ncbi:MAG: hypothetical protein QM500_17495 [Methylococcales bacterium]
MSNQVTIIKYALSDLSDNHLLNIEFHIIRTFNKKNKHIIYKNIVKNSSKFDNSIIVDFYYSIIEGEEDSTRIVNFDIPEHCQGKGIGSFIAKHVYDQMPDSIIGLTKLSGLLNFKDESEARDKLFQHMIAWPEDSSAKYELASQENNNGEFSGYFHDVGNNWKTKLKAKRIDYK